MKHRVVAKVITKDRKYVRVPYHAMQIEIDGYMICKNRVMEIIYGQHDRAMELIHNNDITMLPLMCIIGEIQNRAPIYAISKGKQEHLLQMTKMKTLCPNCQHQDFDGTNCSFCFYTKKPGVTTNQEITMATLAIKNIDDISVLYALLDKWKHNTTYRDVRQELKNLIHKCEVHASHNT